jgi:hypothetical protein
MHWGPGRKGGVCSVKQAVHVAAQHASVGGCPQGQQRLPRCYHSGSAATNACEPAATCVARPAAAGGSRCSERTSFSAAEASAVHPAKSSRLSRTTFQHSASFAAKGSSGRSAVDRKGDEACSSGSPLGSAAAAPGATALYGRCAHLRSHSRGRSPGATVCSTEPLAKAISCASTASVMAALHAPRAVQTWASRGNTYRDHNGC